VIPAVGTFPDDSPSTLVCPEKPRGPRGYCSLHLSQLQTVRTRDLFSLKTSAFLSSFDIWMSISTRYSGDPSAESGKESE